MKLESLALWEEKELFGECSDEDKGYRGYCKYIFTSDGVSIRADNMKLVTSDEQYELVNLMHFLEKDEAHFLTRSLVDMEVYCEGRIDGLDRNLSGGLKLGPASLRIMISSSRQARLTMPART